MTGSHYPCARGQAEAASHVGVTDQQAFWLTDGEQPNVGPVSWSRKIKWHCLRVAVTPPQVCHRACKPLRAAAATATMTAGNFIQVEGWLLVIAQWFLRAGVSMPDGWNFHPSTAFGQLRNTVRPVYHTAGAGPSVYWPALTDMETRPFSSILHHNR